MSLILLLGIGLIIMVLFSRQRIMNGVNAQHPLGQKLMRASWFQNHWLSGLLLFFINTVYFFSVLLIIFYLLTIFTIPGIHLVVMLAAVILSIYTWVFLNVIWIGSNRDRLKMGSVGSSFYLFLFVYFLYRFVTLEPSYPGEDMVMAAVGLLFGMIVAIVAYLTCMAFTAFPRRELPLIQLK
ncbi:hypothetical protein [Tuberibacillus sp. Marseille-P3662]|uniref:hypothetical protein n=1 Tax=Tuberibacillus sp. Marseille-P3662 TaxID=1965358 RepID=UPI000A1CCCFE|nr:hypothetical protein [Tuberibacillus sp. Marseille-P3662]